jgi:signal transduction histidine kinase/CheY-like chemotaxis protein
MVVESTGAGRDVGDALQSLRERVLRSALNVLAFAVPGISLVILVGSPTAALDPMTIKLSAYTLSFPLLRLLHPRLGFRVSAVALLALMALTGFLVEARGGVGNGNVLLNALVLLLGALFFGKRGAAAGLLVVVVLFAVAGVLVMGGHVPDVAKPMWDSTTAEFWWRESIALALVGLAVVVVQTYIVARLATEARRLERLVEQEQAQRQALESAEREREREREQRLDAQKALEESRRIEALARLAGGIAHDFNNSLTVIMGAAESVKLADSLAEAASHADEIISGAQQAAELTRQLLTLGRQQAANPRSVPLAPLFQRLEAALRRVLPDDIRLEMPAPAATLAVHVDPAELERALYNLVLNARDAMPKGGRLRLDCDGQVIAGEAVGLLPGRYVELRVTDTGVGIPPETLDHIFEPFFTTKSAGAGSGLGLATVYAFARESGGMLRVTSRPGEGTTFKLLLLEARTAAPEPQTTRLPSPSPEAPPGTPVLLVEDNARVRESMVNILRQHRFTVTEAADGDQAKALLAAGTVLSVLCIDGVMPGASTREVIEEARRRNPAVRVLLCSGYLREELLRRGVTTGHYAFLQKPFSGRELISAVCALVGTAER